MSSAFRTLAAPRAPAFPMRAGAVAVLLAMLVSGAVWAHQAQAGPSSVALVAGSCQGNGTSYKSPGAQSTTNADPGYSSPCRDVYLTWSKVTNGVNSNGGAGWYYNSDGINFYFTSGTTTVASTHNIASTSGATSGYYGTNTW